jgi:hypothetical protein
LPAVKGFQHCSPPRVVREREPPLCTVSPLPISETGWQELRFGSCVQRVPRLPIVRHLVPFLLHLLSNPKHLLVL